MTTAIVAAASFLAGMAVVLLWLGEPTQRAAHRRLLDQ